MSTRLPSETVISLKNVGVRYKRRGGIFHKAGYFQALKDVCIDIHRGETIGVVGRNGAGKSTLLRVVAGIIKPDEGVVENRGVTVSLLTLQAGFDPDLPGTDNAILGGMLMGYQRCQIESRMEAIRDFSELGEFMEEPVKTYSSGMRSRLGFSVAMYLSPDVLLLDEILSVGDKHFRKKAEEAMFKKIHSNQTVLIVSHSETQIERLCDRVVAL